MGSHSAVELILSASVAAVRPLHFREQCLRASDIFPVSRSATGSHQFQWPHVALVIGQCHTQTVKTVSLRSSSHHSWMSGSQCSLLTVVPQVIIWLHSEVYCISSVPVSSKSSKVLNADICCWPSVCTIKSVSLVEELSAQCSQRHWVSQKCSRSAVLQFPWSQITVSKKSSFRRSVNQTQWQKRAWQWLLKQFMQKRLYSEWETCSAPS